MLYTMDCKASIAAQSTSYPTYKVIDCDLQTNANDDSFNGRLIDCDLAIVTSLVDACKNWNQGIRTTVTIDGQDVTSSLVGAINISRKKNQIATFSLHLCQISSCFRIFHSVLPFSRSGEVEVLTFPGTCQFG